MSNPSKEVMRRSVDGHLTEIERMREFDRGYQAGRQAMDAERHKAIAELRKLDAEDGKAYICDTDIAHAIGLDYGDTFLGRLIHLLGGDEPSGIDVLREYCKNGDNCKAEVRESVESSKYAENCKSGHSRTCPESDEEVSESAPFVSITDELKEMDADGTSPNDDWTCPNDVPTPSIVDELRKWASTEVPYKYGRQLHSIADRIEEQFARVCEMWERTTTDTAQSVHDDIEAECNKLQAECDRLTAALDELHADPANDVICRLERERDELRDELRRKTAEAQGLRHECSMYRDMLLIASDELGSIKKHLDEIVEVLDGRD